MVELSNIDTNMKKHPNITDKLIWVHHLYFDVEFDEQDWTTFGLVPVMVLRSEYRPTGQGPGEVSVPGGVDGGHFHEARLETSSDRVLVATMEKHGHGHESQGYLAQVEWSKGPPVQEGHPCQWQILGDGGRHRDPSRHPKQ